MQTSLQKHHRTLLGALLVVIIASFVLYSGPSAGPTFDGKFVHRGVNLIDDRSTRGARDLASLRALLGHNATIPPDEFLMRAKVAAVRQKAGEKTEGDAVFNLYLDAVARLADADAIGLPAPDDAALRAFIQKYPTFTDAAGAFDPAALKLATEIARDRLGLDERRLRAALANLARLDKLEGVVSPAEPPALDALATRLSEKARANRLVESAVFARDAFTATPARDDKALAEFFEANKENYRIPQKLRLRVAKVTGDIKAADAAPAPSDDELFSLAERRRDRFPLAGLGDKATFLKDNRDTLLLTWREEKAGEAAAARLSETLLTAMPLGETRPEDKRVNAMLAGAGLTATPLPEYGSDALPTGTGTPDPLLERALDLGPARWRTAAIPFGVDAYVFLYDGATPSRLPELAEVKDRVSADRDAQEINRLFGEAASAKAAQIADAVKAGKSFADAAKAAGLKPAPVVSFTYADTPANLRAHMETLDTLPVGGVTGALRDGRDRTVFHLISRLAPDATKDDPLAANARRHFGRLATRLSSGSPEVE